jgi:hypothetical protein
MQALEKHDLLLLGQYYQLFEKDFEQHAKSFENYLRNIAGLKPVLIDTDA